MQVILKRPYDVEHATPKHMYDAYKAIKSLGSHNMHDLPQILEALKPIAVAEQYPNAAALLEELIDYGIVAIR